MSETFGASGLVRSPHPVAGSGLAEHRYRQGSLRIPAELDGIVLAVLGLDDRPAGGAVPDRARGQGPAARAPEVAGSAGPAGAASPAGAADPGRVPSPVAGAADAWAGTHRRRSRGSMSSRGAPTAPARPWRSSSSAAATRRAISTPTSAASACPRPPSRPWGWTAARTARSARRTARTARCCSTSRWPGPAPKARPAGLFRAQHRPGLRGRRLGRDARDADPCGDLDQLGRSEDTWTAQARDALDQACADASALGVTVLVAAGDNGSGDGENAARCTATSQPPAPTCSAAVARL